ncbi:hypothetical protein [Chryseolinea lacunae]|uniref:YbbR-like domain-containing protein n=1 Tax=Chryseolinea lacunae TaxID=2801331 RepID=A0ABS1KSB5_9BACT|nr:hypothetical protein [Chryseolinea lacunae]MBL0741577.1 hypothetical protein [Chryseolinea lacunae]
MSFFKSIFNILRFNRKNWNAILLCIFAAMVFWFFNALNKNYTTNINFPLAFDYDHENFVPVRPLPRQVRINVSGIGWNLFRRSAGLKVPALVIPLDRPADVKKIVGSALPALFSTQLEEFQINFVITDTLHLAIEPKATRWVKLRLDSPSILFRGGFAMTSPVSIVPDSVFIEGPQKLIRSLGDPVYLKLQERNLDENFHDDVEVKFLNDELIKRDPPTVSVTFSVDQLMEVTDSVSLKVINAPKRAWAFIERKKIPCIVAVPQKEVKAFNLDSVKAVIDLKNFARGEQRILPYLTGLPPYSRVVGLDSVYVKF